MDTNYLRSALKTAGAEQANTCTLCGAIVNLPYEEAHKVVHQGDYEPFAVDAGVTVDTCRLCGILVDRSYQEAHNLVHRGDYEPLTADTSSAGVGTCKLCGILVNRSYQEAHDRSHA